MKAWIVAVALLKLQSVVKADLLSFQVAKRIAPSQTLHYPIGTLRRNLLENNNNNNNNNNQDPASCDAAFLHCLSVPTCIDCFLQLQDNDIDWATVEINTSCDDVVQFLHENKHCMELKNDQEAFCQTFDVCVTWGEDDDAAAKNDDDQIGMDCSKLTECNWDGFHPSFIGNGVCNDFDCYNTPICNYDGGDCCKDTCADSSFMECGHDGYFCRDPYSEDCDSILTMCHKKKDTDPLPDCNEGEQYYRLLMYDSFGDGWDETKLTIKQGSTTIFQGGLEEGSQGISYLCLSTSPKCYNVKVQGGVWGKEVSWEVKPLSDAPAIAGGGAPMDCTFGVAGGDCEKTCTGKPNVDPSSDPEYKELKDLYNCIQAKCPIQSGVCKKDDVCEKCFVENTDDFCFGNDAFNALVDCTLCKCGDSSPAYCASKVAPGTVIPPDKQYDKKKECSPAETLAGGAAVMKFGNCTNFDQIGMMVTDFDENNFGYLDKFESCAHSFDAQEAHGGHTALGCMQILVNAMNGAINEDSTAPKEAIAALAKLLYQDAEHFCDCAKSASDDCPMCSSFKNFKTLLYESLDACQSLDEIDCDAWNEFYKPCQSNLQSKFGKIDFKASSQCDYVHETCGGAGPFPSFRRLDCGKELSTEAWDFYRDFAKGCIEGFNADDLKPVPSPKTPAPAAKPTSDNPAPVAPPVGPKPYVPPEDRGKPTKPYTPPDDEKPDIAPDEDKKNSGKPYNEKKRSRFGWFWKLVFIGLIGGAAYYVYKHRPDGFNFARYRYRRMRNFNMDDSDMFSGLALESSTNFEPPSLPPTPMQL